MLLLLSYVAGAASADIDSNAAVPLEMNAGLLLLFWLLLLLVLL